MNKKNRENISPLDQTPNPAKSEKNPGSRSIYFSLASIVFSIIFLGYGLSLFQENSASSYSAIVGAGFFFYGLFNIVVLMLAYKTFRTGFSTAIQVGATLCLFLYIFALIEGVIENPFVGGIFILALGLWCNWIAVIKVLKRSGK